MHVFKLDEEISEATADSTFRALQSRLRQPAFRRRQLFSAFIIAVLAATDDPLDDLRNHAALAADDMFRGSVVPAFWPDSYIKNRAPRLGGKRQ